MQDFKLVGDLGGDVAAFTLTANVRVENSKGGSLELLAGPVALTAIGAHPNWQMRAERKSISSLTFDRSGVFPIQIKFNAAVGQNDGWNAVDFRVAPSILQPIVLQGLAGGHAVSIRRRGAARTHRHKFHELSAGGRLGEIFVEAGAARGRGKTFLRRRNAIANQHQPRPHAAGRAARRQSDARRNEPDHVALARRGRSHARAGDQVLAWNVVPGTNSADRKLVVQFNQPQKDGFAIQVQLQTPLGAFPQSADAMQIQPEGATRFAGHFRIVNDGAVRLEVLQASGLSQISPEQFPESDATRAAFRADGQPAFCLSIFQPGFRAENPGGPDFAGSLRLAIARLQSRRKRTGD